MDPRILLVDDHPIFCAGLRTLLLQQHAAATIREVGNGAAALEQAEAFQPHLVVIDLHLPDQNGIEVSRRLLARFPATKVVMISAEPDFSYAIEAIQTGISGYLLKTNMLDELPRAVEAALAGRLHLGPEINAAVLDYYRRAVIPSATRKTVLSDREQEVLRSVAEGLRTKEIASRLAVSVKTVETYRRRLMKKLACSSTAELVRYALRTGLVRP